MNDGRIQQTGKPQDVYREPANAFVAEFMGMNNLVKGTATPVDTGSAAIEGKLGRFLVPAKHEIASGPASFVIAADRVALSAEPASSDGGSVLKGSVIGIEFVGSTQTVFVDVDGHEFRVQKQQHEIETLNLAPGSEVFLSWQAKHTWLLPQNA
jgi:spermidine/putrescine transport system ATP-binding protein